MIPTRPTSTPPAKLGREPSEAGPEEGDAEGYINIAAESMDGSEMVESAADLDPPIAEHLPSPIPNPDVKASAPHVRAHNRLAAQPSPLIATEMASPTTKVRDYPCCAGHLLSTHCCLVY